MLVPLGFRVLLGLGGLVGRSGRLGSDFWLSLGAVDLGRGLGVSMSSSGFGMGGCRLFDSLRDRRRVKTGCSNTSNKITDQLGAGSLEVSAHLDYGLSGRAGGDYIRGGRCVDLGLGFRHFDGGTKLGLSLLGGSDSLRPMRTVQGGGRETGKSSKREAMGSDQEGGRRKGTLVSALP